MKIIGELGMSIREFADSIGLPYDTVKNHFYRGRCRWPRKIVDGSSKDPAYGCWENMWLRCTNPNTTNYERYGGRGIKVAGEFRDFKKFLACIGPRPSRRHSIDRIDNDGNYEPGNVRWALPMQQGRNSSAFKGGCISRHGRKWRAQVGDNHLGDFVTKPAARRRIREYLEETKDQ